MRPIPEAAQLTIFLNGCFSGPPEGLEYTYKATRSPNNAKPEPDLRGIRNNQSLLPLSGKWIEWLQKSEGDIVMWYCHSSYTGLLPLWNRLIACLHRYPEAFLTPTYKQVLIGIHEQSVHEAEGIFLASNHPIGRSSSKHH